MPGPIRKRDSERRRRNKDGVDTLSVDLDVEIAGTIEIPAPPLTYERVDDEGNVEEVDEPERVWHPIAEEWYLSLTKSGQAIFFEPSDWAMAFVLAEQLSLHMKPRPTVIGEVDGEPVIRWMVNPMPGAALASFLKGSAELMATEGARRKLRIELERNRHRDGMVEGNSDVVPISKKRNQRFAASQEA